jgi:long-chain acyl-CoA synthetase
MSQKYENIYALLEERVRQDGPKAAYYEQIGGVWRATSWQELRNLADLFGMALMARGFQPNDRVAILSANRLIWPVADLGTIAAGGISVGLYPSSSPAQCEYILNHAQAGFVLVDTRQQLEKILAIRSNLTAAPTIIVAEPGDYGDEHILVWSEFLQSGTQARLAGGEGRLLQTARAGRYEDTAIIVYTSGTTGQPKGACLSHRYVLASCESLEKTVCDINASLPAEIVAQHQSEPFVALSFLPFCHVGERISGMYHRLNLGIAGYLIHDMSRLYQIMLEVNPHTFAGLPRFFEKIYAKILNDVANGDGYQPAEFAAALELNKEIKRLRREGQVVPEDMLTRYADFDARIYRKVRANLGSRMLAASSGAAPIPPEVLDLFEYGANLTIFEAYGLTEFVCGAFNTPTARKPFSVGKPMHLCQLRIAPDGEILLRGHLMFSGYYRDEKETAEVIDSDGWLHSGDIGRLDTEGFLFITGRKKEFIKTSTGKKIAPLAIENLCKRHHLISNVMVYGDNRNYLTALITLNPLELCAFAKRAGISLTSYAALTALPQVRQVVESAIAAANQQVSSTEQIKKFTILEQDFSIEASEITPTGKVKRQVVTEKYHTVIAAMYS